LLAITCALIVGAFAERAKFAGVLVFSVLWFTFSYLPMAHMVWYWAGPDAYTSLKPVRCHGNSRLAVPEGCARLCRRHRGAHQRCCGRLVGAYVLASAWVTARKHGAAQHGHDHDRCLHCCGSAGSASTPVRHWKPTALPAWPSCNTWLATAAAACAWSLAEWSPQRQAFHALGGASGAVAGLGGHYAGVRLSWVLGGALAIGLLAGVICVWGVHGLKKLLGADDALDVFGVHGVGGILGALLTGVFASPSLGGLGWWDYVANAPGATT
jgi:Amt family ammonium transporter